MLRECVTYVSSLNYLFTKYIPVLEKYGAPMCIRSICQSFFDRV